MNSLTEAKTFLSSYTNAFSSAQENMKQLHQSLSSQEAYLKTLIVEKAPLVSIQQQQSNVLQTKTNLVSVQNTIASLNASKGVAQSVVNTSILSSIGTSASNPFVPVSGSSGYTGPTGAVGNAVVPRDNVPTIGSTTRAITSGGAYTALQENIGGGGNFSTTSIGNPPSFGEVVMLLHFDGENNATTTTDNGVYGASSTFSFVDGGKISTVQAKSGASSLYANNKACVKVTNTAIPSLYKTDYTVEAWVYPVADTGSGGTIIHLRNGYYGIAIRLNNGIQWSLQQNGTYIYANLDQKVSLNTWHHVALQRKNNVLSFYQDGTLLVSQTVVEDIIGPMVMNVGVSGHTNGEYFTGYIDEVRYTYGYARYNGTRIATLPSAPFPNPSSDTDVSPSITSTLLHFEDLTDAGTQGCASIIKLIGDTQLQTTQKHFGFTSLQVSSSNSALQVSNPLLPLISTRNFTVEGWFYPMSLTNSYSHLFSWGNGSLRLGVSSSKVFVGIGTAEFSGTQNTFTSGIWHHVACVRNGSTASVYIDGNLIVSNSSMSHSIDSSRHITVGNSHVLSVGFNGYIDEFRVTAGSCLYSSNFTVPSTQFTDPIQFSSLPPPTTVNSMAANLNTLFICTGNGNPVTWKTKSLL